jgi:hypothetical protein
VNRGLFIEINRCIYCGKNESSLHNEHGVPVGLLPKGEPGLVLGSASCRSCAEKTSLFERAVLQRLWC